MAYNLTTLKTTLQNLLPSNSRLRISVHRDVNDKILDYLYLPFGIPFPCLSATVPENCHKCDGAILNIADYPYLFDSIGTLYLNHGTLGGYLNGDGITTFNLPFIAAGASVVQSGVDITSSTTFTLGNSGGQVKHTLSIGELPAHSFKTVVVGTSVGNSTFINQDPNFSIIGRSVDQGDGNNDYQLIGRNETPTLGKTDIVGSGIAHNIMQPYIVGNWILRLR